MRVEVRGSRFEVRGLRLVLKTNEGRSRQILRDEVGKGRGRKKEEKMKQYISFFFQ